MLLLRVMNENLLMSYRMFMYKDFLGYVCILLAERYRFKQRTEKHPKYGRAMDLLQPKWDIAYPADDITATCALVE